MTADRRLVPRDCGVLLTRRSRPVSCFPPRLAGKTNGATRCRIAPNKVFGPQERRDQKSPRYCSLPMKPSLLTPDRFTTARMRSTTS